MNLYALGINHTTAAIEVRERLAFAPDEVSGVLRGALSANVADEIALLSTCNRTEVYCSSPLASEQLLTWLASLKSVDVELLVDAFYCHRDQAAARHMMTVASGLDSLVLGEPQILGQMKDCYAEAERCSALGSRLHGAFQQVFSVAKRVRSETAIGENPVSVAYAAVSLAQQIFSDLRKDTAMLVGAGETIELVARHLNEQGIKQILVANRTMERARALADEIGGEALLLTQIPDHLARADIVISSTASPLPLIGKGMVEQALKVRKHKPMFFVDIAVPRDIEAQVAELNDVFLYTVDDLKEVIDEGMRSREQAAKLAEEIIDDGVRKYEGDRKALGAVNVIRQFREQIVEIADLELDKARRNLRAGQDAEQVLERFSHALTNKFLHDPTTAMKAAGKANDLTLLANIKKLFSLSGGEK